MATNQRRGATAIDAHIGVRIRLRRRLAGLSQQKLADRLGLTFQQVQKYERGSNRVSAGTLQEIAEILEAPVTYFYTGRESAAGETLAAPELSLQSAFLLTRHAGELMAAFVAIDPALRGALVTLAKGLADNAGDLADGDQILQASLRVAPTQRLAS